MPKRRWKARRIDGFGATGEAGSTEGRSELSQPASLSPGIEFTIDEFDRVCRVVKRKHFNVLHDVRLETPAWNPVHEIVVSERAFSTFQQQDFVEIGCRRRPGTPFERENETAPGDIAGRCFAGL